MIVVNLRGCLLAALLCSVLPLSATTVLTFGGLKDGEQVLNFYGPGAGSLGSTNFDYGITFAPGAVAYMDSDVGGSGNFANAPSPWGALFSTNGFISFNVAPGFTEALQFYYVTHANGAQGSVNIFSGLNGSGQLLSSATLNPVNQTCPGDPHGGFYGCWQLANLPFAGTARSVGFQVAANQFGIDSIRLNLRTLDLELSVATPEPGNFLSVAAALIGACWLRQRRHAAAR